MKLQLPKYTSKDYLVLAFVIVPYTLGLNTVIFGSRYFSDFIYFLAASFITAISFVAFFILCGGVAVLMKQRFPAEEEVSKRLTIMILTFIMMSGIFLLLLFKLYEGLRFFNYRFDDDSFVWGWFSLGIGNIFLTFLHEGIARYEIWIQHQKETEQLKKAYQHSRFQGLKSQVNPHFLFNSLNSLSSLISEDEGEAEKFLDEMSKVYRYMLRNDDANLVSLETELKFLSSYAHLLKARYGNGLQLNVHINETINNRSLPPLALQTIVENAFTQNSISKSNPLLIDIALEASDTLVISNNIQPRLFKESFDFESGLDNLLKKYELLNQGILSITEANEVRTIRLPLIHSKQEVVL